MSTHNICFYGEIMKIIPKLSSNTFLICSTGTGWLYHIVMSHKDAVGMANSVDPDQIALLRSGFKQFINAEV